MKDEIPDFSFTSFNLNSSQMPPGTFKRLITTSHVYWFNATAIASSVSSGIVSSDKDKASFALIERKSLIKS